MSKPFINNDGRSGVVTIPCTATMELAHHGFNFTQSDACTVASYHPDIVGAAIFRHRCFMMNDGLNGGTVEVAIETDLQTVTIFLNAVHDIPLHLSGRRFIGITPILIPDAAVIASR
jgi:hypothetical protein